ncbi:MAG: DNA repair protein RecN [Treponema sp.]|jgi:DNA repair protein RecN (Recombination protein N)|nr:DNA repair protein RecN [Treponema sp.]
MLEELSIRNFALIDSITLSFRSGLNILTGETGAGKSIIVGSLSFLMGGKTETDVIRTGCDEAGVSAVISVKKENNEVTGWLKAKDIECEEDIIIVRRNIKTSGRGSIFIQNVPVTRQDLAEFMGLLFDLHGQHNHESLLRRESHRRYLDCFAGTEDEALIFYRTFLELAEKRKTLEASLKSDREREERLELLNYAVDEISKAKIRAGEIRELENEAQKLDSFEKLAVYINTVSDLLYDGEQSILSLARRAKNALDSAGSVDASLGDICGRFENLFYEAEDIAGDLREYRENLAFDPGRLEEVNDRLSMLYKLKKKYVKGAESQSGNDEEAILSYMADAEAETEALSGAAENREKLKTEISVIEKDIVAKAQNLRQKRTAAAGKISGLISGILANLGMPNARFRAEIIPKQNEGQISLGPWGAEDVEFLISANTGEPLKDLARIASGGELSRVMLAIKTALLSENRAAEEQAGVETLVFDEIDTGIGGEVALKVGEYLARIGKFKQIFCVTHLASIAIRADNHFKVEKKTESGRTYTGIGPLNADGRRKEIARMLAGDCGGAALAHADDLIKKYGNLR